MSSNTDRSLGDSQSDDLLSQPGYYPGVVKKPDKKVVIGEPLSEHSLESFLSVSIARTEPLDFARLRRAYQSLPVLEFARFCDLVSERSLPLNPTNDQGQTFRAYLQRFSSQQEYVQALDGVLAKQGTN